MPPSPISRTSSRRRSREADEANAAGGPRVKFRAYNFTSASFPESMPQLPSRAAVVIVGGGIVGQLRATHNLTASVAA